MLQCAADLGDNGRNVAFVIGIGESIKATRRSIPQHFTHMRQIGRNTTQTNILKNLNAEGDILILCFRINRPEIVRKLLVRRSSNLGRSAKREINKYFNYVLVKEIEKVISQYLIAQKTSIKELVIEVDSDMRKTLKMAGLKTKEPSTAHDLADIVAWANTKNFKHQDIRDIIITNEIEQAILKRIS